MYFRPINQFIYDPNICVYFTLRLLRQFTAKCARKKKEKRKQLQLAEVDKVFRTRLKSYVMNIGSTWFVLFLALPAPVFFFLFFLGSANKIHSTSRSLARSHSVALLMALCMQIVFYLHTFLQHRDAYACTPCRQQTVHGKKKKKKKRGRLLRISYLIFASQIDIYIFLFARQITSKI